MLLVLMLKLLLFIPLRLLLPLLSLLLVLTLLHCPGYLFDKGAYFADMTSKSATYCRADEQVYIVTILHTWIPAVNSCSDPSC